MSLSVIVELIFLSLCCASLALFIFDIIQEDMVFEQYGLMIKDKWYGKPLGWCPTCCSFWVCLIVGLIGSLSILDIIFMVGLANTFIRLIAK